MDSWEVRLSKIKFRTNKKIRFRIYRKLQGMLAMNEPLARSLERLWYNTSDMGKYPDRPAAMALRDWLNKDRSGESLSDAMADWVPMNELFMIRAGEESGAVANALRVIQEMGDSGEQMRKAVMSAVSYPIFIFLLVCAVLWMFGVNMIGPMKAFAPPKVLASISGLIFISDFINAWGFLVILFVLSMVAFVAVTMPVWTGPVRARFDMYAPWSWYRVWQGSAFLLSLSALLDANVPLKRALEVLEEQSTPWLRERIHSARQEVLHGRNLGEALRAGRYNFPDPQIALDLEILSERSDVAETMKGVTNDWMREQIIYLQNQAQIVKFAGMVTVASIIGWAMMSIIGMTTQIASTGVGG